VQKKERLKLYRSTLKEIQGREDAFAIFEVKKPRKIIQFATIGKKDFLADIPEYYLSEKYIKKLPKGFVRWKDADLVTYEKDCSLDEAVELTEYYFRKIMSFPENYNVSVEFHKGEEKCDLCGKTIKDRDLPDPPELFIDEARQLGIPKKRIKEIIQQCIELLDRADFGTAEEYEEAIKLTKKEGPIFPTICLKCLKKLRRIQK